LKIEKAKLEARHAEILMKIGECEVQIDIINQNKTDLKRELVAIHEKLGAMI
jgi:hypothetical protein